MFRPILLYFMQFDLPVMLWKVCFGVLLKINIFVSWLIKKEREKKKTDVCFRDFGSVAR